MENIVEHKTLSFKDVHLELEKENSLLQKEHNLEDFSKKSDFLKKLNFSNSKATKLYAAIVDSEDYRKDFNRRYNGLYKFILPEQLERVCEKYNLFVRKTEDFCGDIPEKNIKDMMDFKFFVEDAFSLKEEDWAVIHAQRSLGRNTKLGREDIRRIENGVLDFAKIPIGDRFGLSQFMEVQERIAEAYSRKIFDGKVLRRDLQEVFANNRIVIAAVPSLFRPSAFERDTTRLGNEKEELEATGQVDLDPIIMLQNNYGYIIITAWGDESNDELVANQNLN